MKHHNLYKMILAIPTAIACNIISSPLSQANTSVVCDIDYCSIEVHPSLSISASVDNFYNDVDGRYEMAGDLIVNTPAGAVDLLDANLIFDEKPEGSDIAFEVYGIAQAPFGSIPLLGNGDASAQPIAAVGLVLTTSSNR